MFNPFRRQSSDLAAPVIPTGVKVDTRADDPPPTDWFEILAGLGDGGSIAGIDVTPTSALSVPAVRAAVELIAGVVGTLPVTIYQIAPEGGRKPVSGHSGQALVQDDANPWTAASDLRSALTVDALLWGAGYALCIRDKDGNPRELHRLLPSSVIATIDPITSEPSYRYDVGQAGGTYGYRDVVVIRPTVRADNVGAYGIQSGLAPIRTAREAIALCIALENYMSRLMRNGGRPSGVLSFADKLGSEAAKRIKASWQAATAGGSSGGTAVLESGGKFQQLSFSSVDAQFAEMRQFQILEIARAFGIPPPFLGDHGKASFQNYYEASRQLTTFGLMPWFKAWEAAYRRVLLTDEERKAGLYASFDLDALLQGDLLARSAAYSNLIAARVLSPNEVREKEHMPSYKGGDEFVNPNTTAGAPPAQKPTPPITESPRDGGGGG